MRQQIAEWLIVASRSTVTVAVLVSPLFLVGFVLSIFRRTRPLTGLFLYVFSFVVGAATWFYGAAVTFATFGWFGLFVGLVLFGVGVVPIGILGGFWEGAEFAAMARGLILMLIVTFAFRFVGSWLMESGESAPDGGQP